MTVASLVHLGLKVKEVHVETKVAWELLAGTVMMDSKGGRGKRVLLELLEHPVTRYRMYRYSYIY